MGIYPVKDIRVIGIVTCRKLFIAGKIPAFYPVIGAEVRKPAGEQRIKRRTELLR